MEGANYGEATTLIAEFTTDVNHVLEMENMAGIERRAAERTANGDFAGDKAENSAAVSGGTSSAESPERRTGDSGAGGEEKTMEDLVREVRQEWDRREGSRRAGGICDAGACRRAEHNRGGTAENLQAFDGRKGGCTRDIDAGADADRTRPEKEGRTTGGRDSNGTDSATTSTRDARSNPERGAASATAGGAVKFSTADALRDSPSLAPSLEARISSDLGARRSGATTGGPRLDADRAWDYVSDDGAAGLTMAARSRAGTGGRPAESGGGGNRVAERDRPTVEYERDGAALLPRFRPADIASVLKGPPVDPAMQFEIPNELSFDERVARALNARSPRADAFGGGKDDAREVGAESMDAASVSGKG